MSVLPYSFTKSVHPPLNMKAISSKKLQFGMNMMMMMMSSLPCPSMANLAIVLRAKVTWKPIFFKCPVARMTLRVSCIVISNSKWVWSGPFYVYIGIKIIQTLYLKYSRSIIDSIMQNISLFKEHFPRVLWNFADSLVLL